MHKHIISAHSIEGDNKESPKDTGFWFHPGNIVPVSDSLPLNIGVYSYHLWFAFYTQGVKYDEDGNESTGYTPIWYKTRYDFSFYRTSGVKFLDTSVWSYDTSTNDSAGRSLQFIDKTKNIHLVVMEGNVSPAPLHYYKYSPNGRLIKKTDLESIEEPYASYNDVEFVGTDNYGRAIFVNRNVYCMNRNGDLLWTIHQGDEETIIRAILKDNFLYVLTGLYHTVIEEIDWHGHHYTVTTHRYYAFNVTKYKTEDKIVVWTNTIDHIECTPDRSAGYNMAVTDNEVYIKYYSVYAPSSPDPYTPPPEPTCYCYFSKLSSANGILVWKQEWSEQGDEDNDTTVYATNDRVIIDRPFEPYYDCYDPDGNIVYSISTEEDGSTPLFFDKNSNMLFKNSDGSLFVLDKNGDNHPFSLNLVGATHVYPIFPNRLLIKYTTEDGTDLKLFGPRRNPEIEYRSVYFNGRI